VWLLTPHWSSKTKALRLEAHCYALLHRIEGFYSFRFGNGKRKEEDASRDSDTLVSYWGNHIMWLWAISASTARGRPVLHA